MGDLDFKGVGEHLPVIATALVSLAVIVGTVMKGYNWLTDSWKSSIKDEVNVLNKDIERLEKRLEKLEDKLEDIHGRGSSVRSERSYLPD